MIQRNAPHSMQDVVYCLALTYPILSPQRTGLLSMLDVECGLRGTAETYLQKVRAAHRSSGRLRDPPPGETGTFAVQHYAGLVVYSAADFLGRN